MATEINAETLAEIKARIERASPGPWFVGRWTGHCDRPDHAIPHPGAPACHYKNSVSVSTTAVSGPDGVQLIDSDDYGPILSTGDANFIAHARQDLPAAVQTIETLQRTNRTVELALEKAYGSVGATAILSGRAAVDADGVPIVPVLGANRARLEQLEQKDLENQAKLARFDTEFVAAREELARTQAAQKAEWTKLLDARSAVAAMTYAHKMKENRDSWKAKAEQLERQLADEHENITATSHLACTETVKQKDAQIQFLAGNCNSFRDRAGLLQEQLLQARAESPRAALQKQCEDLEAKLASKDRQLESLTLDYGRLVTERYGLEGSVKNLTSTCNDLKASANQIMAKLDARDADNRQLKKQSDALEDMNQELRDRVKTLSGAYNNRLAEYDDLHDRLKAVRAALDS